MHLPRKAVEDPQDDACGAPSPGRGTQEGLGVLGLESWECRPKESSHPTSRPRVVPSWQTPPSFRSQLRVKSLRGAFQTSSHPYISRILAGPYLIVATNY